MKLVTVTRELTDAHGFSDVNDCALFHAMRAAEIPVHGVGVSLVALKTSTRWAIYNHPIPTFGCHEYNEVKSTGIPWLMLWDEEALCGLPVETKEFNYGPTKHTSCDARSPLPKVEARVP